MDERKNEGRSTKGWTLAGSMLGLALLAMPSAGLAAPTPSQKCESSKNGTVGKYAACMHKAQSRFVKGGEADAAGYDDAVVDCGDKFGAKWQSVEDAAEGSCPVTGDRSHIQDFVDACIAAAEEALGGAALPLDVESCNSTLATCDGDLASANANLTACGSDLASTNADLASCSGDLGATNADLADCSSDLGATNADLADCSSDLGATNADLADCADDLSDVDAGTAVAGDVLAGKTFSSGAAGIAVVGTLRIMPLKTGQTTCSDPGGSPIPCASTGQDGEFQYGIAASFTDNGDGTITDNVSGLVWEKLSDDDSIHDKDYAYDLWVGVPSKLASLNGSAFAGYTDWRLPNIRELETLRNFAAGGIYTYAEFNTGCSPTCTVLTCSCTQPAPYWSSTSYGPSADNAWTVDYPDGSTSHYPKFVPRNVRAVRGGS